MQDVPVVLPARAEDNDAFELSKDLAKDLAKDLCQVAEILTWSAVGRAPSRWRRRLEARQSERLALLCAASSDDACLLEGLALLPPAQQQRFLCSPMVASCLIGYEQGAEPSRGPLLADMLLAALAQAGAITELPAPVWSAHGDREMHPEAPERWASAPATVAGTRIVLDERSPHAFPLNEDGEDTLALLTEAERTQIRDKLARGFERLHASSEPAFALVSDVVDVIAIRRETRHPHAYHSSSFSRYVGLMLLSNFQLPKVTVDNVIGALVHEAIHSLLFTYEAAVTPFLKNREDARIKIASPWTGASISLAAYIHACVVWYGLYWLWTKIDAARGLSAEVCHRHRERARAGFLRSAVSGNLAPHAERMTGEIRTLLDEIERRMQAAQP